MCSASLISTEVENTFFPSVLWTSLSASFLLHPLHFDPTLLTTYYFLNTEH